MNAVPPRRGLGRGLGSLIPTAPAPTPDDPAPAGAPTERETPAAGSVVGEAAPEAVLAASTAEPGPPMVDTGDLTEGEAYFAELPAGQIRPNERQPRQDFDADAMAELVHSIREVGLLQPVVVRRLAPESFELVMGERRWRACQEAGLDRIPAIVRGTDDTDMLRDALLENLHRSQLNPLEEAAAYGQLLEDFSCTHEELADRIGRSRPQISNTLRLLKLSPAVQRRVAAGVLSAGHARALLSVEEPELQDRLAQRVVAEGISVRGLEEIVAVGDNGRARRQTQPRAVAPGLSDLADRLSDKFETRVRVDMGKSKGKITVDFATLDDLQRIIDVMDPRNRTDRPI